MPVSTWKEIELSKRHLFFSQVFFLHWRPYCLLHHYFPQSFICLPSVFIYLKVAGKCYWTKMYPIVLTFTLFQYALPHVIESSEAPPLPNPILESHESQSFSPLPRIPILARALPAFCVLFPDVLNPSLLQFGCNRPGGLTKLFHAYFPNGVGRYWPSAINEYTDSAVLLITISLVATSPGTFMPTQILEKDVFQ